ncbi:hypothetical protein ACUL41_14820 [Virgibacillus natechei]
MTLKQLENQLDQAIESYRGEVVNIVDSFHNSNEKERQHVLPETLDDMNRQAFYTFYEFQKNIIKYLKEVER